MGLLQTVTGLVETGNIHLADGHGHVWIDPPSGVAPEVRLDLNNPDLIGSGLQTFAQSGGSLIVDCQPGGCGRDARRLAEFSKATGVWITATTGFHQRKYYPPEAWLWSVSVETATRFFVNELTKGMQEANPPIPATTIKIGYEGQISGQTQCLMEAAAEAALQTGATILFHTERGKNVEALLPFFESLRIPPDQLYLCHMDKRPDLGLHQELAQAGVLLGYDTFVRPQYEEQVWGLLKGMVEAGFSHRIAICLDFALTALWHNPGWPVLTQTIIPRLRQLGILDADIARLTGQNIAQQLVRRKAKI